MADEIVVFVTASSREEARKIGSNLVDLKLVACVNIIPSVQSIFRWKGEICNEEETLMILKTMKDKLDIIIEKIKQLHSYDVPEIIALPIIAGSQEYLDWINQETRPV